ncbi:BON domain-containing protein [Paraburkholderia phenazinium]|nr:BON domain-containing protein [Paraburkholderia phenazinium]
MEFTMTMIKEIAIALAAAAALVGTTCVNAQTSAGSADNAIQPSKKALRARNFQLEKTVRRALTHTKDLDSAGITVLAKGGVVALDGTVPDNDEIQIANDAAAGVAGVSSVKNNLIMRESGH